MNQQPGQSTNAGQGQSGGGAGESVDTTRGTAGAGVPQEELEKLRKLSAAQEAALRDYHRQNTELTQRLRDVDSRIKRIEHPEPSTKEMDDEYWKSPTTVLSKLIKSELEKTVQPLNDRIMQQTTETAYDRAKKALATQYSDIWDKIEGSVDQFVQRAAAQGVEVNDQLMQVAALTASGMYYRGQIPGVDPYQPAQPTNPNPGQGNSNPVNQPTNQNTQPQGSGVINPPHMRPSAPRAPTGEPEKPALRELTENERRLMRERGWTQEQFLAWLDVPPEQVIHSKIGREEKK